MNKILRVNMGAEGGPKIQIESLGEYEGLGGRGMTSMILLFDTRQAFNYRLTLSKAITYLILLIRRTSRFRL